MSIFLEANHLFLINPKGGVEDVQSMKDAGFQAIFCNVLDFHPDEWALVRSRAEAAGVVCGPWARPIDASFSYVEEKFHQLVAVADAWGAPCIVNLEKELDGTGSEITGSVAGYMGDRDYAISMEAWPFDYTDWEPFRHVPVLPQIFPQEVEAAKNPYSCRDQWWARGVECVVFTFGTYWAQSPNTFDLLSPYGLYPADAVPFHEWAPRGDHQPCKRLPPPEPKPPEEEWTVPDPITDEQARYAIVYAATGSIQNYEKYKPLGRVQVCQRIANAANTDDKWNACRDAIVQALDEAGVPK